MLHLRPIGRPTAWLAALAASAVLGSGCGAQTGSAPASSGASHGSTSAATSAHAAPAPAPAPVKRVSSAPVVSLPTGVGAAWTPVATVREQVAAWIARRSGVTYMRFDQQLVHLALHAGSGEPGPGRWLYGDRIGPREVHRVLAGFNGGFKLSYGSVGFMSGGHVAVPLSAGLGSIVTYSDGLTQIAAWRAGVPAAGRPIASVRQNLHLLVDHGLAASSVESCVMVCWGRTLGGGTSVPRSALGITADGQLLWAAGESLSPAGLASALIRAGAERAVELDINPFWVAGYLYVHHPGGPSALPVVPGQHGIAGELLEPANRDFFTILAN
jgi:hypothetical protein